MMEFHPSQIPAIKTFEIDNEKSATIAADQMVDLGFEGIKGGYLVLMPKEKRTAKRIGYTITTAVNYGLRRTDAEKSIRRYAIIGGRICRIGCLQRWQTQVNNNFKPKRATVKIND